MKVITTILSSFSGLLLLSVLICGLWIRSQKDKLPNIDESINFHVNLGIAAVVFSLITIGVLFFKFVRN